MKTRLSNVESADENLIKTRGVVIGWQRRFTYTDGGQVRLRRVAPNGQAARYSAEFWEPLQGVVRPIMIVATNSECAIRMGRRLLYADAASAAIELEHLDASLKPTGINELLNPAVPPGDKKDGITVALIDAGVNYLLPAITERLARTVDGEILGYDYWDLDHRPFDSNPARSAFFPQRHGTRTASLLAREAPLARLVPYRYPRPAMHRMTDLVRDAARKGISIVNLSLGGNKAADWKFFSRAAEQNPHILFVVSAGNNGRDIDEHPVYPAALPLNNIVTVTSSEIDGRLAPGSNYGKTSVDLLVPGEHLIVTGFDGNSKRVSGSSYAAARISALAVRLRSKNPTWRAAELKSAILGRAIPPIDDDTSYVAHGFIPDPETAEQRSPVARDVQLETIAMHTLNARRFYDKHQTRSVFTHELNLTLVYFERTSWKFERLEQALKRAANILGQCGIGLGQTDVHRLRAPEMLLYFTERTAKHLASRVSFSRPTVYFLRDTLKLDAYEAEAIGKSNSHTRPTLTNTVWMTENITDAGIGLAHEVAHILMDNGQHVDLPENVMRADTSPDNVRFTDDQCETMRLIGTVNQLLQPVSRVTHMLQ